MRSSKQKKAKATAQPHAGSTNAGGNPPKSKRARKAASKAKRKVKTAATAASFKSKEMEKTGASMLPLGCKNNMKQNRRSKTPEVHTKSSSASGGKQQKPQRGGKNAGKQKFQLLDLPQHVQCRIYKYAVFEADGIDVTAEKKRGSSISRMPHGTARPALAASCKRLRGLVLALYFKVNTFRLICANASPVEDYERVCAIDPAFFTSYGRLVKSFEIHLDWHVTNGKSTRQVVISVKMMDGANSITVNRKAADMLPLTKPVLENACACGLQRLANDIAGPGVSQRVLLDFTKMCVALPRHIESVGPCKSCKCSCPILPGGTPC